MAFKRNAFTDMQTDRLKEGMFYSDADSLPYCFTGKVRGDKYYFRRTDELEDESRVEGFIREAELHMLKPAGVVREGDKISLKISGAAHRGYDLVPNFKKVRELRLPLLFGRFGISSR